MNNCYQFVLEFMNLIILFGTVLIVFWYTLETKKLRENADKTLIEVTSQKNYERQPYISLALEGKDKIRITHEALMASENDAYEKISWYTEIKMTNIGRGIAKNIKVQKCTLSDIDGVEEEILIQNVIALGSNSDSTQLKYGHQDHRSKLNINRLGGMFIEIEIEYEDVVGERYSARFVTDENSSDGFAVDRQEKERVL
jgi:hypothetical protein